MTRATNGRLPGLARAYRLHICPSCRAGDHQGCRPYRDEHRRLLYCECWGPLDGGPTCLEPFRETP